MMGGQEWPLNVLIAPDVTHMTVHAALQVTIQLSLQLQK